MPGSQVTFASTRSPDVHKTPYPGSHDAAARWQPTKVHNTSHTPATACAPLPLLPGFAESGRRMIVKSARNPLSAQAWREIFRDHPTPGVVAFARWFTMSCLLDRSSNQPSHQARNAAWLDALGLHAGLRQATFRQLGVLQAEEKPPGVEVVRERLLEMADHHARYRARMQRPSTAD